MDQNQQAPAQDFYAPTPATNSSAPYQPPLPPRRAVQRLGDDDPSSPIHYTRDPHKLVGYLIPFPKPRFHGDAASHNVPDRFLIYTPPPPPLLKPPEGEKEERVHKVQRKWQEEVRNAKTSTAKTASWKGMKSKATKGIDWAMSQTKSANLEFLNRLSGSGDEHGSKEDGHAEDGIHEEDTTHKTVGLEEMLMIHPGGIGSEEEIRTEFVNSMLRSKSKAYRDSVIATGLLPVSAAIDILATVIWPFGGLLEEAELHLKFVESSRLDVLARYLAEKCHERDPKLFHSVGVPPTETDVLEAIGWSPSHTGGNWEDEQWEITEVKDDVRSTMKKGAREFDKWAKAFEKNPEKALKK
ncbi:MAG: hypothetical protein M1820_000261 [Bogoriella megaspora]|nr:MAG: hypothetical protein M1820_000261 [Bogoriella megaspora]